MREISQSVIKKDHGDKISGKALYVDDIKPEGLLHGRILHAEKPCAEIAAIRLPELPGGYCIVDRNDVPGENRVSIVDNDTPVFAEGRVNYVGEPILMVVGPDPDTVERILREIKIDYREETPVLDPLSSDTVFYEYGYTKGDPELAFREADRVIEEEFETGYQEQAYLEPQGMIAWVENEKTVICGSLQCPYYVFGAVQKMLGCKDDELRILQAETGGGFGGKEDFPSHLACQAAVAARKTGLPVKVIFSRREDMASTSKRHPAHMRYRTALSGGKITAMDIEVTLNAGAYTTLSKVVLQRSVIGAGGVYRVENLRVRGRAVRTNTVPCGAFRGFGAPQTFFGAEMHMSHLARVLGTEPLELKTRYMVRQGDSTSTSGRFHTPVLLPEMIRRAKEMSGYEEKRKAYARQDPDGRYRRGIGISLAFHGCGFTGSGERDHIKAVARLKKNPDDTVEILVSNSDMGQGVETTFSKIVAQALALPLERVLIRNPDTDRVPDSGPTVASRSIMTVGRLLERAALRLKQEWKPGEEQLIEERYKEPDFMIPFDPESFQGDAYPTYNWSVDVVEVCVDALTGETEITGAWAVYDVGVPIDENILRGQMEGGLLQGLGWASMEQMDAKDGRIRNGSFTDYIIPTAADVPVLEVDTVINPYVDGPFGAKGAGEVPTDGPAPAYLEAMEQALGCPLYHIPFTMEDTLKKLEATL